METQLLEFYATCPQGFEHMLAEELKRLQAQRVRPLKGGVAFFGGKTEGYRACLWSRIASRVTRVVDRVDARTVESLYSQVREIAWENFIGAGATIAVTAHGTNGALRNTQFTALKVKDAICDHMREAAGWRPDVAPQRASVPVWVSLHDRKATISLDYAGEPLHRRGYRMPGEQVDAPLKESLAAAMLVWGGWDRLAAPAVRRAAAEHAGQEGTVDAPSFVDPACGSGTLVLEAAMMASGRAPGLLRDYWGFAGNADFDAEAWDALLDEADERFERGLENMPLIVGADLDPRAVRIAQDNARRLGMSKQVRFVQADCAQLPETLAACGIDPQAPGFLACNPPYGVRLLAGGVRHFHESFAQGIKALGTQWSMVVITPDANFDTAIGYEAAETLAVYNGAIEAQLRRYVLGESFLQEAPITTLSGVECPVRVSSDHALQFAARLRKMAKTRRKWARKQGVHAYRIYDADLPDYAVSIDWIEEAETGVPYVLVNEYRAPKEIDPTKAARRFHDACTIVSALLEVPEKRMFTRERRRDKGGSQYASDEHRSRQVFVEEAGHIFELDLSGYLDTGLFLDHRLTRALVGRLSQGKAFLNLFAYTGTASVYAAAGGANETTTVDLNNTYLDWARRNMERNGFSGRKHRIYRADVLSWVDEAYEKGWRYDVAFVDPPTFSNSKAMGQRTWDIQRDHAELLAGVRKLMNPGGVVVFSGNLRTFKFDEQAVAALGFTAENVTAKTIPEDFSRSPRIHFCYVLRLPE